MATSKSTPRIRPRRHARTAASAPEKQILASSEPGCRKLEDVIEDERSRLMTAESVLHCAEIAMNEAPDGAPQGPHYPTLIALARDLIKQSIDQLDSLRLGPMLENAERPSDYTVREHPGVYVH